MRTKPLIVCLAIVAAGCVSRAEREAEAARVAQLVQDYAPPFCYLVAEQMALNLKVAMAQDKAFKGALPSECAEATPAGDNAAWKARLESLRADSIRAIEQRDFTSLPRDVEVLASPACGVNRPLDGASELRQSGYRINLALPGLPEEMGFRGAIMENHVVFLMVGGTEGNDPLYSEPLFGDWSGESLELRGIDPDCAVSITPRG